MFTDEAVKSAIRKVGMFGILGFPDAGILVQAVETLQQQNEKLKEGLKSIENKLAYLPYDHDAKLIVMDMIDKLFDSIHVKDDRP